MHAGKIRANALCRICVISLLRIALWRYLEGQDLTYTATLLYLFTALEPLLGIVLASLPIIKGASTEIINSSMLSWTKTLVRTSTNDSKYSRKHAPTSNSGAGNAKARDFYRLQNGSDTATSDRDIEDHPLQDI